MNIVVFLRKLLEYFSQTNNFKQTSTQKNMPQLLLAT